MFSIGLVMIPLVTYFVVLEINNTLPQIEVEIANLVSLVAFTFYPIAGISCLFIIYQWINIELQFREYYKSKKIL